MRLAVAALTWVLAGACGGPAPVLPPSPGVPSPAPSVAATAPTPPAPAATAAPPAPAPPPSAGDPALAWLPPGATAARGVQTAVAVLRKPGPAALPEQLDPRALAADPDPHAGKSVVLYGQAARHVDEMPTRWVELLAQPPGETQVQAVDLLLSDSVAPVEPEECYRVVGVAAGRDDLGRNFTGRARDVPLVLVTAVAPAAVGPYGIGCAPP